MNVVFTEEAERDLKKLSHSVASRIVSKILWFGRSFNSQVPQPLSAEFKGLFKLRVGDWRVIYEIDYSSDRITIHLIDHRSRIYKRKD